MRRCAIFTATISVIFSMVTLYSSKRVTGIYDFTPERLHFHRVSPIKTEKGFEYIISETTYERPDYLISDLTVSFNKKNYHAMDDSGKYRTSVSSYSWFKPEGSAGDGAGYFYKRNHRLEFSNSSASWLGNNGDLGSFTIEFRLNPASFNDEAELFSRVGYNSGTRNGILIQIKDRRIHCSFFDLFTDDNGQHYTYEFASAARLQNKTWYYTALSYDRLTGKVELFIDGKSQVMFYATDDGTSSGTLHIPSFFKNDMPNIVFGKNYFGYLDEFRLSYRSFDDLKKLTALADRKHIDVGLTGRVPVNSEGVVTSPVYEFQHTGTMIKNFVWTQVLDKETFIWFEVRLSDDKFDQYHQNPRWYRITNNQRNIYLMKTADLWLRGKYFQWRAHLISSPDGERSPVLQSIKMNYELDTPPIAPLFPECIEQGDGYVVLRWKKNVDHDFFGYKVYYGVKSGKYEGVLVSDGSKPITNGSGDFVELKVDNRLVEENRLKDTKGLLSYPLLKNNVLYYFAVTAYDSYRVNTPYNHESDFSKEISGRPFGGSEIKIESK
ncbi:MAG: hypothetical protein JXK07_14350 [Spirochaetes bacterium]|nr:hypothetical protein [Spirochaetota bacterium]MBN2770176.1 hypothetical protein [Spirochaetota bacterium]